MITFLLRDVPEQLHAEWHHFAKQRGTSMRKYALLAIKTLVEKDKENVPMKRSRGIPK